MSYPIREPSVRVTVEVAGRRRVLASLTETKTGSVIVALPGKQNFIPSEDGKFDSHVSIPNNIIQHKYSVHPSRLDLEGNQIHHRIELESGDKIDTYHFTKAIKNGKFAYISGIRSDDMHHFSYDVSDNKKKEIFLGLFDLTVFSLYYAIVACGKDNTDYLFEDILNYNTIPFVFSNCIVILIWSYALIPTADSRYEHIFTVKRGTEVDKAHRKINKMHIAGMTKNAVIRHYLVHREKLRSALEEGWRLNSKINLPPSKYLKSYFHDGVLDTYEWFDFNRQFPNPK